MFVRNSLKTLTFAAAVAMIAGSGSALAQEGGDGSLRVTQPLSERVAQAQAESVTFAELFSGQSRQQAATAGQTDTAQSATGVQARSGGVARPDNTGFQHEAWRDMPPRR